MGVSTRCSQAEIHSIVGYFPEIAANGEIVIERLKGTTSQIDTLWAHVHEPPPALSDVAPELPRQLGDVLARALAKDPDDRQQSAGALASEALAALRRG